MLRRHLIAGALLAASGARAASCAAPISVAGTMAGRLLVLDAIIDGLPARLLLDTGGERSVLTQAGVAALRLPRDQWVSSGLTGVGGTERQPNADVGVITLGGLALRRPLMSRIQSLPVIATIPVAVDGAPVAGLLCTDLMSGYDIDLDFTVPRMVLQACGAPAAWTEGAAKVASRSPRIGIFVVPARVNGQVLRALIDTGSSVTLLDLRTTGRLGITPATIARGAGAQDRGIGPGSLAGRRVTLARLELGKARWVAPVVQVAMLRDPAYDMVLGMDLLGRGRMLLSSRHGAVWVGTGRD